MMKQSRSIVALALLLTNDSDGGGGEHGISRVAVPSASLSLSLSLWSSPSSLKYSESNSRAPNRLCSGGKIEVEAVGAISGIGPIRCRLTNDAKNLLWIVAEFATNGDVDADGESASGARHFCPATRTFSGDSGTATSCPIGQYSRFNNPPNHQQVCSVTCLGRRLDWVSLVEEETTVRS
jgi:hypothetical protein